MNERRDRSLGKTGHTIAEYLRQKGPMSARDISAELRISRLAIELAWQDGFIVEAPPEPGGWAGKWYRANWNWEEKGD